MSLALLSDRGVVSLSGADAEKFLQGLITNDMGLLAGQEAIHAGLLSPQGKILFDFFVVKAPDGFLLDVAGDKAADLVKRLTLYKLRAKIDIADVSQHWTVSAAWNAEAGSVEGIRYKDPRLAELGERLLLSSPYNGAREDGATYHAHRIACGVPEGGKDYAFGDAFPHEALFDQLNGVSFTKGCYVGQEIVARMENRSTARKRIVPVLAQDALPAPGSEIMAGDVVIGMLGTSTGEHGLALLRLDRAAEFAAKGVPITVANVSLRIDLPSWATFAITPADQA